MHCSYLPFILIVEVTAAAAAAAVVGVTFSCDIIMIIVLGVSTYSSIQMHINL